MTACIFGNNCGVGGEELIFVYVVAQRNTMTSISARIPDEEEEELREVAELLGEDKSSTIRKALREGLGEIRVRLAVERYQSGEVSVNEAARIAGLSVAEWLEVARERNLTTQLKPEDLEDDADSALDI